MKLTKIYAGILALLGFQMQSCDKEKEIIGTDEYGCPYTVYKTKGSVKDQNGNNVADANVEVNIKAVYELNDSIVADVSKGTAQSNSNGIYEVRSNEDMPTYSNANYRYEVITNKEGYDTDTTILDKPSKDITIEHEGEWGAIIEQEINVVLKKK